MIINLHELIEKSISMVMAYQKADGSMPSGHNGPYDDPETPVRNSAHFLFLFSDLFQSTGEPRYRTASEKIISYLFSPAAMPYGKTFYCRDKTGKDKCNGLIGQAWVIEALVKAANVFDREDCYELAEKIFYIHPWDKNVSRWKSMEIDGKILPYDNTFNHQLWFAAIGSLLKKSPIAMNQSLLFIRKVASRVHLYSNGVIFHSSPMGELFTYFKNGPESFFREFIFRQKARKKKRALYFKSVGYHGFNLYAFALLKNAFPDESIWETDTFKKLINVCNSIQFQEDLKHSEFGYYYNLSGIEIAYAIETFFNNQEKVIPWIERQYRETYDCDNLSLSRGALDKNTAIARIYEAARLRYNYDVEVV